MRYRKLDSNGDYTFGKQDGNFHSNSPEAVAQAVKTSLGLSQGEWFLDTGVGVPYSTQVLGMGNVPLHNQIIREAILNVPGVKSILSYSNSYDPVNRFSSITCTLNTVYGSTTLTL
jgi:hypothetical protein